MTDQMIRPVSDLRNNFADVSRIVHETGKPVFLTKNGFGDMVVLSMEAYENLQLDSHIYDMLLEGEREAETTGKRFNPKETMASMRAAIDGAKRV
ncbi:type II toxin-antitoxin system Phd/YefM family antitoxin [Bifidobacterium sp. SO1]|uniref:type II toxin-antitoxin system Phd/YefM family antitoxin n=1 Tax=Bifidobacterium sp. SO1 TaxID=2809029 RepID=UPI001BDDC849|nr:type II toxin-antitoxin system Phd/YefM family antitoxin [Bifidobacterium sp. SO1]MBT1160787.1 type II toxin-antitoxin system Phd/YefM family antitoxin [Bifidobacterium sp. SO1]